MAARTITVIAASLTAACAAAAEPPAPPAPPVALATGDVPLASEDLNPRLLRRWKALAAPDPTVARFAIVELGRALYHDPRLSADGSVSCESCHPLASYGATGDAVSTGVGGHKGRRNAPSTYHAAGHFRQFWDGRAATIEEQALAPMIHPDEMGMTPDAIVATLDAIAGYQELFARAFPGETPAITTAHVGAALGAFERGLVTPSRWDLYVGGDRTALSSREKQGAKLFANLGCVTCHTGTYLGGTMFQKAGARVPWPNQADRGRQEITGAEVDAMRFKVPSLRNVARTAPYFHDGSAATLADAVRMMAHHQLDTELTDDEVDAIVAWFDALTGEVPAAYIAAPALPGEASGR